MDNIIDRLKEEHRDMETALKALLLRVARRPASRMALEDTLAYLDEQVEPHERREEASLFPHFGAATDPLEPIVEAHATLDAGRKRLRDALLGWTSRPDAGPAALEELACVAEELIHEVLQSFEQEERQVFNLARAEEPKTIEAQS